MAVTASSFANLHKIVYKGKDINAVPQSSVLQKLFPLEKDKIGASLDVPVQMKNSHGATYTGNALVTLNADAPAVFAKASIVGYELILRDYLKSKDASTMVSSEQAYRKGTAQIFKNLLAAHSLRVELGMLYGQSAAGIGEVSANSSGVLTITLASWIPFIWPALLGATLEAFTSGGTQHNGDLVVSNYSISARTVTVTGTNAAVVAGDLLFLKGSRSADLIGIDKIATNSGSLFGINAATYPLWGGSSYSAGSAALTRQKVLAAAAVSAQAGSSEDLYLLCSISTAMNLADQESVLVSHAGKDSEKVNGAEYLSYLSPTGGKVKVIPVPVCKEGEAFLVGAEEMKCFGNSEVKVESVGVEDCNPFFYDNDTNSWQYRSYSDLTMFTEVPAHVVKIVGIINS